MKVLWIFIVCFSFHLWQHAVSAGALKFCTTTKRQSRTNDVLLRKCKELNDNFNEIVCQIAIDRLTCLKMLSAGLADFAILEPEDLSITTMSIIDSSNILVTHELKMFSENKSQYDLEMIAIVKNNFDNTWVTKDKKLCYIGFETGYKPNYQYHYTSYFEKWLINKNCDPKKTLIENRIADISYHFESACIAGPWTLDAAYDGILKSKYKNLCALCGSPSGCYEGDRFYGMQGAISCLLENVGEIAWLSRSIAVPYFAEMSSYGFSLLCPDGMFIPLSVNKTCTWITEPRPTIVARSEVADRVLKSITDMERSGKAFYSIVHASYKFSHLKNVVPALIPEEYMRNFQGYLSSKVHSYCPPDRTVRWCVSSNIEASKCGWIQAAALAVDIQPKISCIQQKDKKSAIQAIVDDRCDVYIAKPEEELNARSMNLTPIAHLISNKDLEANRFAAIVKKDAKFKNFNDLKGSNACFTGYKSVGWNSFFTILRNSSSRWDCSDAKAMSQFFNRSCVYGLSEMNTTIPKNLYSLCNSSYIDKSLGPEENTFKCLMNGGDVAFVNVSAAKKYYSEFSIFYMNYKILCQDETNKSEEPCFLVETTLGSILASKNITQVRKEEIYLLFLSLDRFFGNIYDRETAMFTLYGPYEGHSDIIFPDKTQHLQKHVDDRRRGQTYEEILENLQDKVICGLSSNSSLKSSISFLTFMIFHAIWTLSA